MTTIAVDAMGGDNAPGEIVHGAVLAAAEFGIKIQLVGHEQKIINELKKHSAFNLPIEIINADEVVEMGDKNPAISVRKKKASSIVIAMNQVAEGNAVGVVSAGSTGAAAAAAFICLKRIDAIERPSIAAIVPTINKPIILVDGGANVEATKYQILQNAFMGTVMAKIILKIDNPRVGLLNIGEEPGKGNQLVKEAYEILSATKNLNFIGNVEGRAVAENICDVCVCDGFVGNIFLKTAEGYSKLVATLLKEELTKDLKGKIGAILSQESFYRIRRRIDYSEYGGAQLLGVKGVCVIAHGSSHSNAIKNAIRVAKEAHDSNIVGLTEDMVKTCFSDK